MNKKLVVVGIVAVLLLAVGLSGCIFEDEDKFITLPDGTKVYGDFDKLEILNYSAVTEKKINGAYEKLSDGVVYSENASRYRINITAKNVADKILGSIRIMVRYYDEQDNELHTDVSVAYSMYMGDIGNFSFTWDEGTYHYFECVDHISFKIYDY